MKIYRPLVVLFVFICGLTAFAQDSSEFASLRAKAVKGNGIAQYNLGLAYVEGKGTAVDPIEGFVWLSLARENGARGRALDNLVSSLNRTTYEAAQKRLAERKAELGLRPAAVTSTPATAPGETPVTPDNRSATNVAPGATSSEDTALAQLRAERDGLAVRINNMAGDLANQRAERERLIKLSGDHEKAAREAAEAGRAAQTELERTKQSLAALQSAPKPAADTSALDQKARELQTALTELETARNFGSQVEGTLNKVTDQKTALDAQLASANQEVNRARQEAAMLARARDETQQQLNAVAVEHTALQTEVAQLRSRPGAPAYPDLSGRVRELEASLAESQLAASAAMTNRARQEADALTKARDEAQQKLNAITAEHSALQSEVAQFRQRPAAPAYPDLASRVRELESGLAESQRQIAAKPAAPKFPDLSGRVRELEAQVSSLGSEAGRAKQEMAALTKAKEDTQRQLAARPAAPSYPDLSGRVSELEGQLARARQPAAPKYPDLSDRVRELESALAAKPAAPVYSDLSGRVQELEKQLGTASTESGQAKQAAQAEVQLLGQKLKQADLSLQAAQAAHTALQAEANQLRARPAAPAYPDLRSNVAALEGQLTAAQQALAARSQPVVDSSALDRKDRELQAALAELEASRTFGRKVEDTLNKVNDEKARVATAAAAELEASRTFGRKVEDTLNQVNDEKARVAAAAAAELEAARKFGQQVETTLNRVTDQKTALDAQLANANQEVNRARQEAAALAKARDETQQQLNAVAVEHTALQTEVAQLRSRPAVPAYPNLTGRVAELETSLAAARKPAAPAYPDLSSRVAELETALVTARKPATTAAAPDSAGRLRDLETALADTNRQLIAAQNTAARPNYPDLSGRVGELEAAVATALQKFGTTEQARADLAKQFDDYKSATITAQRERTTVLAQVKMLESDKAALRRQVDAATAETGQLRTQVAGLKMQQVAIKPAAPAYPDLSGKVGELEAQVNNLQTALAAKPAAPAYPDLSGRVGELEAQVAAKPAGPAYPDLSGRVSELEGQLARARQPAAPRYPDLSGRVRELEAQVSSLGSEAGNAKQEMATLAKAKGDTQAQLASLTAERDNARNAQGELRETIAKLTQEKAQLAAASNAAPAYPDLRARVASIESDLAGRAFEITRAKQEMVALTQAKDDAQKALAARPAAPAYPDLSGKVGELEAQVGNLQTALAAKPAAPNYPNLSGRVQELEAQVAAAGANDRQGAATLSQANEQIAQLKSALAAKPAAPGQPDLSGRVSELETALAALSSEAANAKQEVVALTKAKEADLSAVASAKEEAASAKQEVVALTQAKEAAEKPAAPAYPDLSGRVTDLTGEVAQLRADRERMQKMLADAGRQLRDGTADANRIKDLEAQIASRQLQDTLTSKTDTPDQWGRILELEAKLAVAEKAAGKPAAPAYPDLSDRVRELETAAADSARQLIAAEAAQAGMKQQLAEATAAAQNAAQSGDDSARLRRERDELSGRVTDLAGEVAQLRTDRERMQKMLGDAGRQLRDGTADTARIKDLETQLAGLQGSVMAAQTRASGSIAERDALSFEVARARQEVAALTQAKEDARNTIARLEQEKSPIASTQPSAPAYPDLSDRVRELEAQVAGAPRGRAPAYPDLAGRVSELEAALAEARQRPATSAPAASGGDNSELQQKLADTENRLTTSLRGYAMLERERDELAANASKATAAVAEERNALAAQVNTLSGEVAQLQAGAQSSASGTQAEIARLSESLTALQRSTAQNSTDLAATRALAQQLQGANAVLAGENYQLKTMLSRTVTLPVATRAAAPAPRIHVVANGDSLSRISQRYYGTANRWQEIFNANTDRINANGILRIGTELRIP